MENPEHNFILNKENLHDLNEIRKWTYFLAILGFIGVAFMIIIALFIGSILESTGQQMPVPHGAFTGIYLLIAIIYFFPVLYLFKFSTKTRKALYNKDGIQLTTAFANLKRHYKFLGVLTIIIISVYILAILFAVLGVALV